MTEKLLQFIWRFQYFNRSQLQTAAGEELEIIFPGHQNLEQGPDFLQARIRIDKTVLAGSIELHLRTSDWERHRHTSDPNYQNVVLHVVYQNDSSNCSLPLLELQPRISSLLLDRYERLMQAPGFIPCNNLISQVPGIALTAWLDRCLAERLQRKASHLLQSIHAHHTHWEEGFWQLLARSFGGKTNGDAFEAVAQSVSLKILAKHRNSLPQIEALLMGQARLLGPSFEDAYPQMLLREYRFLQQKYNLQPINLPLHFLRMRPSNFPTIRMAQLAALVYQSSHLFSKVLESSPAQLPELFQATANDYWHYHYRFDEQVSFQPKRVGNDMVHHIMINVVAPTLFAYGNYQKQAVCTEKAIELLQGLPPESNSVVSGFIKLGIKPLNAGESQALLELRNSYCNEKRCLECAVGNVLLRKEMMDQRTGRQVL